MHRAPLRRRSRCLRARTAAGEGVAASVIPLTAMRWALKINLGGLGGEFDAGEQGAETNPDRRRPPGDR